MLQYLGIYFLLLVYIMVVIMNHVRRKNKGDKISYFDFRSSLYYAGNENPIKGKVLTAICVISYSLMFIWALLVEENIKNPTYCNMILQRVELIEGSVLAYFGVVVSVIIFSVTLGPKEYYLNITRGEVNRRFGIHIIFQMLSVCAVVSIICLVLLPVDAVVTAFDYIIFTVYEMCCMGIILLGMYGLIIIGILTLSSGQMELRSLNKLHRKFWDNSALKLVNYTDDVIRINLGYLMKQYTKLNYVKNDKLGAVKQIEFIRELTKYKKWQKKANLCLFAFLAVTTLISVLVSVIIEDYIASVLNLVLFFILVIALRFSKTREAIGRFSVAMILFSNGFLVKSISDDKKEIFISLVAFVNNIFAKKYIRVMCNLMGFYCIICSCWKKKRSQKIVDSLEEMIGYIDTVAVDKVGFNKAMLYLPVFLCGYFYYANFSDRENLLTIINLFDSFKLSDEEKKRYFVTINSFILYANRYRPSKIDIDSFKKCQINEQYYEKYIEKNGYSQMFEGLEY